MPEEYSSRFNLSNLWDVWPFPVFDGIIFLKKMLELTKTSAEPNALRSPKVFDADTSKEHANITPIVSGRREIYVLAE